MTDLVLTKRFAQANGETDEQKDKRECNNLKTALREKCVDIDLSDKTRDELQALLDDTKVDTA